MELHPLKRVERGQLPSFQYPCVFHLLTHQFENGGGQMAKFGGHSPYPLFARWIGGGGGGAVDGEAGPGERTPVRGGGRLLGRAINEGS